MHSTVCYLMLVLPVIGWNAFGSFAASNGLQSFDSEELRTSDFVSGEIVVRSYSTPFQLSARDDRIKDCLRSGNCKN